MSNHTIRKICTKCKIEKPLEDFYRDRRMLDGYRSWCKACAKAHQEKHKEKTKAYVKKYYEAHKEDVKARGKKYYEAHKGERRAKEAEWAKANPDKIREKAARRRARKLSAFVTDVNRQEIFVRDGGICHICKRLVDPNKWHLDHIIPLSRGGTHEPDNVSVAHPQCNLRKGASLDYQAHALA